MIENGGIPVLVGIGVDVMVGVKVIVGVAVGVVFKEIVEVMVGVDVYKKAGGTSAIWEFRQERETANKIEDKKIQKNDPLMIFHHFFLPARRMNKTYFFTSFTNSNHLVVRNLSWGRPDFKDSSSSKFDIGSRSSSR